MITIYKKNNIPKTMKLVYSNDVYFNKHTAELLDERAEPIIEAIDQSEMKSKYTIQSKFDGGLFGIDKLSTGCKTALNIFYNPHLIFDIRECGDNALDVIYKLPSGNIYCDYPMISFDMEGVLVRDLSGEQEIHAYDSLKEWWTNER